MEVPGIEPGASHMQSERSTTELYPQFKGLTGNTEENLLYVWICVNCWIDIIWRYKIYIYIEYK